MEERERFLTLPSHSKFLKKSSRSLGLTLLTCGHDFHITLPRLAINGKFMPVAFSSIARLARAEMEFRLKSVGRQKFVMASYVRRRFE